ncbi:hypothetical protein JOM56_015630 [Amanita muscaria]
MHSDWVSRSSRQAARPYATGGRPHSSPPITPQLRPISLPSLPCTGPRLHRSLRYAARPRIAYDLRRSPSRAQALSERGYNYVTLNDVLSAVHEAYQRAEPQPTDVGITETESIPILFSSHSTASARYMWAGLSDYVAPGAWLLHIEEPH